MDHQSRSKKISLVPYAGAKAKTMLVPYAGSRTAYVDWTEEDKLAAIQMFNDGASLQVIGEKYHKSRGAISGLIWRARKSGKIKVKSKAEGREVKERLPPANQTGICEPTGKPPRKKKPPRNPTGAVVRNIAPPLPVTPPAPAVVHRVRFRLVDEHAVTFEGLKDVHCKWPMGDPQRPDFRFCGCYKADEGPYCEVHTKMAARKYDLVGK